MEEKPFAAGDVIFKEGDPGDSAFLIATGTVEIARMMDGKETVLGEITAGQIFGEMALINDQPRTATARAKEDVVCVLVPPKVFEQELNKSSALMRSLVLNLIRHIRSMMVQLEEARKGGDAKANPDVVFHQPQGFNVYKRQD